MKYKTHLLRILKAYKTAFYSSLILAIALMVIGITEGQLAKTITYLTVITSCFLLSEFIFFSGKPKFDQWKVKRPKRELYIVILATSIAGLLLTYWFCIADQENVSQTVRIVTLIIRLLFAFPVFLLVYFFVFGKYRAKELGLWNFKYWFVSLPLIVLIGGITYLTFPEGMQFKDMLKSNGIEAFILLGFFTAAIPEEIVRSFFQSRLAAVIDNKSIAWFVVSLVWALKHIPLFSFNSGNYYDAIISALGIMPIGLLWGYLNERYKSIIPAVLMHGTNLWGLQNIF